MKKLTPHLVVALADAENAAYDTAAIAGDLLLAGWESRHKEVWQLWTRAEKAVRAIRRTDSLRIANRWRRIARRCARTAHRLAI
jgi:hypothetical protein